LPISFKKIREDSESKMSFKSWIIPFLSTAIGLGMVIGSFVFGVPINETHVSMLDYLLVLTLGSGAIGASSSGFKRYKEFKNG